MDNTITKIHFPPKGTDPHFGRCPCAKCGTTLAGDRHDAVKLGWDTVAHKVVHLEDDVALCTDCLMTEA